jgi:hypothetical protein
MTAVRWLQRAYNHQSGFRRFHEEHLQPLLLIQHSLAYDPRWHLYRRNEHPPHHRWNATIYRYFVFLLPSFYNQSLVPINKFRDGSSDAIRVSICTCFDCMCDLWSKGLSVSEIQFWENKLICRLFKYKRLRIQTRPPMWSSGQSFWLQFQKSWVRIQPLFTSFFFNKKNLWFFFLNWIIVALHFFLKL